MVTVPNPTVQAAAGETLQVSDLFSATDADNDTLTFLFNDTTPGGGHFAVNGVEQAANQVFSVTPAELAQTTFVPAVGGSDDLVVGASDGHAFSGWSNLHIEGTANQAPVVTVPNPTVQAAAGEILHLSDLISAGGGSASAYLVYDTTPGGGHILVSGNPVYNPADTAVAVTPALFAQTTFIPGIDGSDHLLVGAFNAYGFSGWAELNII